MLDIKDLLIELSLQGIKLLSIGPRIWELEFTQGPFGVEPLRGIEIQLGVDELTGGWYVLWIFETVIVEHELIKLP